MIRQRRNVRDRTSTGIGIPVLTMPANTRDEDTMTTLRRLLIDGMIRGEMVVYLDQAGNPERYCRYPADGSHPAQIESPGTVWGSGVGDLAARSNWMWWSEQLETHGEALEDLVTIEHRLSHGYESGRVVLNLDAEVPDFIADAMGDLEFPAISDEHYRQAEAILFDEDWRGWIADDLEALAVKALTGEAANYEGAEDAEKMLKGEGEEDYLLSLYERARESWWDYGPWVAEGATEGCVIRTERNGVTVKGLQTLAEDVARLALTDYLGADPVYLVEPTPATNL